MSNINAVFQYFRCPNCDTFFSRTFSSERYLTACSEQIRNIYPNIVHLSRETLFDKLNTFSIKYTSQQKLFKKLAIFDFESTYVQKETFQDTKWIMWIGKHVAISVSIPSKPVEESLLLCNSDPHHPVAPSIGTLEISDSQSKAKMKNLLPDIDKKK